MRNRHRRFLAAQGYAKIDLFEITQNYMYFTAEQNTFKKLVRFDINTGDAHYMILDEPYIKQWSWLGRCDS